ncbi:MAG: hypothetical protein ACXQT5_07210 [Candidatus Syntropharchaeia archaeon]
MKITGWIGTGIFLAGIIVLGGYSIYPVYNPNVEDTTMLFGIKAGITLLIIGGVMLMVELCIERYREYKEMKEKFTEEELRP